MGITYPAGHGLDVRGRRAKWPITSASRCSSVLPYVLGGRGMAIVYDGAQLESTWARRPRFPPTTRCTSIASSRAPSRSTSTAVRWGERVRRRHPGAYRDGGHSFRRLGVLHAALRPVRRRFRPACAPSRALVGASPGRNRPDQHPIRHQGHGCLRHRGEPAREPHGSVCLESPRACRSRRSRRASWRGKIADLGLPADDRRLDYFSVKEAVMPFGRFPAPTWFSVPR